MYESDDVVRKAIDSTTSSTTFDEAWDAVAPTYHTLRMLCGDLATVIANNAAVESDFSILKWEMDEFRRHLMHLSLEGIFQCKRRHLLGLG